MHRNMHFYYGRDYIKKYLNYSLIAILGFYFSAMICYNLTTIITNNLHFAWTFRPFTVFFALFDLKLLFGTTLFYFLTLLFIAKYTHNIKEFLKKKKNELPKTDGNLEYGSSRWATDKEIKDNFKAWNIGHKLSSGGIPVTYLDGTYYYADDFDHSLIIGSTGSGKSLCEIFPLIFNLGYAGESMVINDTKGELYSLTADFLKNKGYEIKIINLRDAFSSDKWNPLHLPYKYYKNKKIDEAGDLIENLSHSLTKNLSSKDMYWEKSTNAVLSALCYALLEDARTEKEVHLYSIYNLLVEHGSKYIGRENSLDKYFQQKPQGSLAKLSYATGSFAKGDTRATLFSVLATVIKMFSDTGIANLTSSTDFELEDIGKKKTAVYLIIPDEKESRHELASLFVDQCYQALVNEAQLCEDGKLPIRTNFILDEFGNMPSISSISNKITVSRSRNIRFTIVIQNFKQLEEKYKESAETIKSNCTNWIYLLTSDNKTAKDISERLGKYTISSSRTSTSTRLQQVDFNISNDKSLMGRELLTAEELMRLKFGEAVFMKTRMHPIKATINPIMQYPISYNISILPNDKKHTKIKCFDLDKFRNRNIKKDQRVELE